MKFQPDAEFNPQEVVDEAESWFAGTAYLSRTPPGMVLIETSAVGPDVVDGHEVPGTRELVRVYASAAGWLRVLTLERVPSEARLLDLLRTEIASALARYDPDPRALEALPGPEGVTRPTSDRGTAVRPNVLLEMALQGGVAQVLAGGPGQDAVLSGPADLVVGATCQFVEQHKEP